MGSLLSMVVYIIVLSNSHANVGNNRLVKNIYANQVF